MKAGAFPLRNRYYGRCGGHTVTMFLAVEQTRVLWRNRQQWGIE